MILCIPVERDEGSKSRIYGHFGSAPVFILVDPESMEYSTVQNDNSHHAHGMCNPVAALGGRPVDGVLLASIGRRALEKLHAMGITVYRSSAVTVEEAAREHLEGNLEVMTLDSACGRHGQHHGRVQGFVDLQG
jgi:predicted Fe-Mo cluster-binding NifX family protein